MTITFLGHGYVGLVTAAVFADLGNTVWVIGHTAEKIENLKKGILPIYEPGLEEIVKRNVNAGRLLFTLDYDKAIPASEVVFIAVGTPPKPTGEADLSVVFEVAEKIAKNLTHYTVVVTKSTVPVGTNKEVQKIVNKAKKADITFDIASCPEFLREGQAIGDTEHPDRIVIGTENKKAEEVLLELHKPITGERVLTNVETAEMIKYAANAFLATKISFANAIAQLSEKAGADAVEVLKAIGEDKRIGKYFLNAGAGYGGSCFPKDVKALISIAKGYGYDFKLLKDVEEINKDAMNLIVEKVAQQFNGNVTGKTIGVLGLSFKPDTDDMRDAPAIVVIKALEAMGAKIKGYDPISMDNAKRLLPTITLCKDAYDVIQDADAVVLMTEWNEFKELDLQKVKSSLKTPIFIDARNVYEPEKMKALGFVYSGVGR
ncbi:MAG TPA: UDP-glucose/GDP-mannose dehydrogenase family protein [Candidatus Saccharimonadales bacterium]|nr:UDP-glucose/GDP-mannose dehydrogenase family protein [Candidatus Saccharimonadales bacterium]